MNDPEGLPEPVKAEMRGLTLTGMTVWIVDSNAFIHLGSIASEEAIESLKGSLSEHGGAIHVTSGVHDEVRTVRFRAWRDRPRVLDVLSDVLHTTPISEGEIRGLANAIGEKAAPQDVDVSLMVLAAKKHGMGLDVVLVSDDYKMTTTREKAGLGYDTCPPSTFIQSLSDGASGKHSSRLRSLAKRIRAAEMRYAISRAGEYDIQGKLTWLIESLLSTKPSLPQQVKENAPNSIETSIQSLRRHVAGENVKKSNLKRLGALPEVCQPIREIDDHLESLLGVEGDPNDLYLSGLEVLQSVLERVGAGLSPLGDEQCMIAHRVMSGPVSRLESVLGLLAGSLGRGHASSLHMARALSQSTLSDDSRAEAMTMHHLGLMAIASEDNLRASMLFERAADQSALAGNSSLAHLIAAGISRHLAGEDDDARTLIATAARIVQEDKEAAIEPILGLARSLMGIDRPWLALELFDEALECAVESGANAEVERITNLLTLVNVAAVGEEDGTRKKTRDLLDRLNEIQLESQEEIQVVNEEIDQLVESQLSPLNETWRDWRDSSDLIPENEALIVVRVVRNDEGVLAVTHHPDIGGLGLWLPGESPDLAPGIAVSMGGTRIKLAEASDDLIESQNIRGVIAVETPGELMVSINSLGEDV